VGSLARRLTALEEIAEAARLRPYRKLAAELGAPFEEILREVEMEQARMERLLAGGLSLEDLLEQQAARHGISVEALERELEQIELRYFT